LIWPTPASSLDVAVHVRPTGAIPPLCPAAVFGSAFEASSIS
jgi:hypothetical protein